MFIIVHCAIMLHHTNKLKKTYHYLNTLNSSIHFVMKLPIFLKSNSWQMFFYNIFVQHVHSILMWFVGGLCTHNIITLNNFSFAGLSSATFPMYIAESAPSHLRGQLVTLNNMFITGGQLVAGIVAGLFSANEHDGWRSVCHHY